MKEPFYITTPIYFPNANPHIGHSYTTVAADTMARYKKMRGYDVMFLTGTDEHGQKIERVAKEHQVTPKEYVDKIVDNFKKLWRVMDIEYDIFIRTTDQQHEQAVQKIFKKLYDQGDIYKSSYEGWYCTPCETFFTERQLAEGRVCPDCGRKVEMVKEESYFFRLSKYQDRLLKHFDENPEFILPLSRKNEMVNNFLKPGLEDLAVSRTSFTWGVPVEFDPGHVVYVWVDALSNYITALGYLAEDDSLFQKYWPADVHLMAKEIVRFHSIIWPALLMALDLPLPKQVVGHGWLIIDGGKMSKSQGNVVDPFILVDKYGVDAIRYFLMREIVFGQDGNFTNEALIQRINADLANDLGNLLSRTVGMIDKYFGGQLPAEQTAHPLDAEIMQLCKQTVTQVENHLDKLMFNDALGDIWTLIRRTNKYTDETAPWVLCKDESKKGELANVLYVLSETLRVIATLISPFMPHTPFRIAEQIGFDPKLTGDWESAKQFGILPKAIKVHKGDIVFPRIDLKKELAALEAAIKPTQGQAAVKAKPQPASQDPAPITIDDFGKVQIKIGTVLECKKLEGSDKLLVFKLKIGDETRQIVSGIAKYYEPEQLLHKQVACVTNLKPVKLRGVLSEGMILSAEDCNGLKVITVDGPVDDGAGVR